MINDIEIWKDIPRYKGIYQASNMGRIRRLRRSIINHETATTKKGAIISQSYTSKGYKRVRLHFNGKIKEELVHSLWRKLLYQIQRIFTALTTKMKQKQIMPWKIWNGVIANTTTLMGRG